MVSCPAASWSGVGIGGDEGQPAAVGRPGEVGDAAGEIGDPLRLATGPVEQPDLLHLARVVAGGEEGEVAAVGAPARRVLLVLAVR